MAKSFEDIRALIGGNKGTDKFWFTDFLESGIASVDWSLGGGLGYGRMAEIFGNFSAGKSLLLYRFLIQNQQKIGKKSGRHGVSILLEAEGAYNPEFFRELGGDPEKIIVKPVDTVEEVFNTLVSVGDTVQEMLGKDDDTPFCIGWDGIAATSTQHAEDTDMEKRDFSFANQMSKGCKMIMTRMKKGRICVISTNQTRTRIGDNSSEPLTPGGTAYPFACSQRIELSFDGGWKGSRIYDPDEAEIGRWTKGNINKNKLAAPFGKFELPIYVKNTKEGYVHPVYGTQLSKGIDMCQALYTFYCKSIYDLVHEWEPVIEKSGQWHKINPRLVPDSKSFYAKDWPSVLGDHPELWHLSYQRLLALRELANANPIQPS